MRPNAFSLIEYTFEELKQEETGLCELVQKVSAVALNAPQACTKIALFELFIITGNNNL